MKRIDGGVTAAQGFTAAGIHCGVRKNKSKKDLALLFCDVPCAAAAVYTQNLVKGAPILVTRAHLLDGRARAVVCNSGNANTCNADGVEKAARMCRATAEALHIDATDVVVASPGVIGQPLPIEPILAGIPTLAAALSKNGGDDAELAIMTTDTREKTIAVEFKLGGKTCRMGGMAKGSGMIHPNMATMLAFVTTDAAIASALLQEALTASVQETFNMVSVDGDTSTNDMLTILASGLAGNEPLTEKGADYDAFCAALREVNIPLAREIARDGEGATKLLVCEVTGARTQSDARAAAKSVVCSSLLKAAMFGADANWGRVLCALGYAQADLDPALVSVAFSSAAGRVEVCRGGAGLAFSEELAAKVLAADEIHIEIELNSGAASATAWGCDLTYDYVKINGDYRT